MHGPKHSKISLKLTVDGEVMGTSVLLRVTIARFN